MMIYHVSDTVLSIYGNAEHFYEVHMLLSSFTDKQIEVQRGSLITQGLYS
jgi:hypothetical protein